MTRLVTRLVLAALAVVLTACLPDTRNFLADRKESPADTRLLGAWYISQEDDTIIVHFVPGRTGPMEMVWMALSPKVADVDRGPVQWRRYAVWTTRIDGVDFLNLDLIEPKPQAEGAAMILRYTIGADGQLTGYMMGPVVADAIKRGELAGVVEGTGAVQTAHVTANRDALIAFIKARGATSVFSEALPSFRPLPPTESERNRAR
ncbi:MAG: hypothetical protein ACM3N5_14345 [Candidatus Eiseniibacteriota bacterium]